MTKAVAPGRHFGADPERVRRVAAVVVSYNRRPQLMEALAAVTSQDRMPDDIIVVDNASTDGTADAVRLHYPQVRLIVLPRNTGGAGGFAVGISAALAIEADLVWLMDDDTVPEPDALRALLAAGHACRSGWPELLASRVVWTDGRDHPMNTPRRRPFQGVEQAAAAQAIGGTAIRSASFVSILVDAAAVRRVGLPRADYFLWNDDFEFSSRLLRTGTGVLCPRSVVVHKTRVFGGTDVDPGERFYYEVRNKIWMLRSSEPLSPWEKLLYGGATLRRWLRTFLRSSDRRTLARAFARGLRSGVSTRPRPTADVIAGLGLQREA